MAGFWEVNEETRGRGFVEEMDKFSINPFDEVLVVDFASGYIPFANIVGLRGAVKAADCRLLEEDVLKGFLLEVVLNWVLH
jgi:hypothetical protein